MKLPAANRRGINVDEASCFVVHLVVHLPTQHNGAGCFVYIIATSCGAFTPKLCNKKVHDHFRRTPTRGPGPRPTILPIEKIRTPNIEVRNNLQKLKLENGLMSPILEIYPYWNLKFVSDFEFIDSRFSDLKEQGTTMHLLAKTYCRQGAPFRRLSATGMPKKKYRPPFYECRHLFQANNIACSPQQKHNSKKLTTNQGDSTSKTPETKKKSPQKRTLFSTNEQLMISCGQLCGVPERYPNQQHP